MHQRNFALNIRRDWTKPPNVVTMVRMLLAFPVAFFALIPDTLGWIGFGCYVLAVSTDWVDGWLAKRNDGRWKTELGKFLDPLADKLLIGSVLIMLVELTWVPGWIVVVIICRELAVTGMRGVAADKGTFGAAERFYLELSEDNRRILVERAVSIYDGRGLRNRNRNIKNQTACRETLSV
jgi:phosphatidylglycerophosphate synthase